MGVLPQGGERETENWAFWNYFKISILVILYGSDCFDLAAARYVRVSACEQERVTENQTAPGLDKNKVVVSVGVDGMDKSDFAAG